MLISSQSVCLSERRYIARVSRAKVVVVPLLLNVDNQVAVNNAAKRHHHYYASRAPSGRLQYDVHGSIYHHRVNRPEDNIWRLCYMAAW